MIKVSLKIGYLLSLTAMISGCQMLNNPNVHVTVRSQPDSGVFYLNEAPLSTKTYKTTITPTETDALNGFIQITLPEVRWPSGITLPEVRWPSGITLPASSRNIPVSPRHQTLRLQHPAPGSKAEQFDQEQNHIVRVTYYSEPNHATLLKPNKNIGPAPATQVYAYDFEDYQRGYIIIPSLSARWPSGAQAESGALQVDLEKNTYEHTFLRPVYPNIEIDVYAAQQIDEHIRKNAADAHKEKLLEKHRRKMEEIEKQKLELLRKKLQAEEEIARELLDLEKKKLQQTTPDH